MEDGTEILDGAAAHTADTPRAKTRVTQNRMTIYEKACIIGVRASQLSDNAPPFIDVGSATDCIQIATRELEARRLPFIVRRKLPNGAVEDWGIDELLIPEVDF